jgi:hypothetical protein
MLGSNCFPCCQEANCAGRHTSVVVNWSAPDTFVSEFDNVNAKAYYHSFFPGAALSGTFQLNFVSEVNRPGGSVEQTFEYRYPTGGLVCEIPSWPTLGTYEAPYIRVVHKTSVAVQLIEGWSKIELYMPAIQQCSSPTRLTQGDFTNCPSAPGVPASRYVARRNGVIQQFCAKDGSEDFAWTLPGNQLRGGNFAHAVSMCPGYSVLYTKEVVRFTINSVTFIK